MSIDSDARTHIIDPKILDRFRRIMEDESALVFEHWFYRGSRAPHRFVTDSFEDLEEYLRRKVHAGDLLHVWKFADCCRDDNELASVIKPRDDGSLPEPGPY